MRLMVIPERNDPKTGFIRKVQGNVTQFQSVFLKSNKNLSPGDYLVYLAISKFIKHT